MTGSEANEAGGGAGIGLLFARASHVVNGMLASALTAESLTLDQYRVLLLLSDEEPHPMTAVAEEALIPAPRLTRVVDRLVESNLVLRRVDAEDRRRSLLFLTRRGVPVLARVAAREQEAHEHLAVEFGSAKLSRLLEALREVAAVTARLDGEVAPAVV